MSSFLILRFILVLYFLEVSHCFNFISTVSKDGTGDFVRVSDAIAAAPDSITNRIYIHIKPGLYVEHVEIPTQKTFISLIGDDASNTVILDGRNYQHGSSTISSATFTVKGNNFMGQFITFVNSAGPKNGQAIAFLDEANHTSYYKCVFKGYQDTLFVRGYLQFFKKCDIYGSVDFIFGEGLVVFQDCNIYARLSGGFMTAQSKTEALQPSDFSFQNCNITASPEMSKDMANNVSLGRPWRNYSTVIVMQSFLDTVVDPKGWQEWGTPLNELFYAEYHNHGSGADTSNRVKWPEYHVLQTEKEASKFTVENFINGLQWLQETGIPFRSGL